LKPEAYELMEAMEASHWWFRARREIVCSIVRRYVAPGSEILDFGCGAGRTARSLLDLGYRVTAADVAPQALAACRRLAIPTLDASREELPRGAADCVLAGDVLEHVADDLELLLRLRAALRPAGILIVTVPAYEFLWSGEDHVSEHFRRYTRGALKEKLIAAGYAITWTSYFNTLLFPGVAAAILATRLFRPRAMYRSNVSPAPRWLNEALYRVFAQEERLLRRVPLPAGMSILAVAAVR
jgi:2-polyprenyl-3-methyl-5-hydroxy-6-metoxy-1,4-benzoquinol methylase